MAINPSLTTVCMQVQNKLEGYRRHAKRCGWWGAPLHAASSFWNQTQAGVGWTHSDLVTKLVQQKNRHNRFTSSFDKTFMIFNPDTRCPHNMHTVQKNANTPKSSCAGLTIQIHGSLITTNTHISTTIRWHSTMQWKWKINQYSERLQADSKGYKIRCLYIPGGWSGHMLLHLSRDCSAQCSLRRCCICIHCVVGVLTCVQSILEGRKKVWVSPSEQVKVYHFQLRNAKQSFSAVFGKNIN
jgi:hypothetical protein